MLFYILYFIRYEKNIFFLFSFLLFKNGFSDLGNILFLLFREKKYFLLHILMRFFSFYFSLEGVGLFSDLEILLLLLLFREEKEYIFLLLFSGRKGILRLIKYSSYYYSLEGRGESFEFYENILLLLSI